MTAPAPKNWVTDLPVYVGGKTKADGGSRIIKLSSNENARGCSPKALEAYKNCGELHRYPQDGCLSLREELSALHGFAPEQMICGTGSDEVLNMLVHAYAGPGDEVMFTEHGFLMYRIFTQHHGATPVAVPETAMTTDVDAILAAVTPQTRLLFLANPNNPTGSYLAQNELHRLRDGLRDDIILVLDGAYAELIDQPDYTDGRELVENTNTVLTRTFSKVYGLPSLRLGWGYGPQHIIDTLYKIRPPFNITGPAMAAAIAALQDQAFISECVAENKTELARISSAMQARGFAIPNSHCNFWLLPLAEHSLSAKEVAAQLSARGIIVREIDNYGLNNYLRITTGTPDENDALLTALEEIL